MAPPADVRARFEADVNLCPDHVAALSPTVPTRRPRGRPKRLQEGRVFGFRLERRHNEFLDAEAERRGESRSAVVRAALDLLMAQR